MADFKPGDVVVLRSGGPRMTVMRWPPQEQTIRVVWFAGDEERQSSFGECELRRANLMDRLCGY